MVPPVPIPNTVVKHSYVESTWLETTWEDRKLLVDDAPARVRFFYGDLSPIWHEARATPEERERSFNDMIELALESIIEE